jgi:hypothetical protein
MRGLTAVDDLDAVRSVRLNKPCEKFFHVCKDQIGVVSDMSRSRMGVMGSGWAVAGQQLHSPTGRLARWSRDWSPR